MPASIARFAFLLTMLFVSMLFGSAYAILLERQAALTAFFIALLM
jgi:hypothetical protein